MSSYPVFSGSTFATNTNHLPFNPNPNVNNIPPPVNAFQQNANMAFLSFPPPSLPGSHHVFQNGPRFPGAMNPTPPFNINFGNSNGMSPSGFSANTPGSVTLRPPAPFAGNNNLMMSPASFATNPAIAAVTSMPPPNISPWNPAPNPRNFNGNFQQLQNNQQGSNALNINPWSAAPPNNFQNTVNFNNQAHSQEDVKPWGADPSKLLNGFSNVNNDRSFKSSPSSRDIAQSWDKGSPKTTNTFNNFQNREIKNNQYPADFHNSISPWSSDTNLPNLSNNVQYSAENIKSPPKFGQSRSPVCDINPWVQSPPNLAGSSTYNNNYQFSNGRGRPNQQNFHDKKNYQQNFNHKRGNSRNFPNGNQHNNRQWQDKRSFKTESNESKPFSCDTCDRAFSCQIEFQEHVSEHVKCNFKNCQFEAHPKIVSLHKRMQHDTGYAEVINKLKNSDEIEKWRAERRRRFPTSENILKRKAEQAEKEARGEVIENKEFGKFKKQKTEEREPRNNRFKKNRRNNKRNRFNAPSVTMTVSDSGSDSDDDSHIKLRKFGGVLAEISPQACETVAEEISNAEHNISEEENIDKGTSESFPCINEKPHIENMVEEKEQSILEISIIEDNTEGSTSLNPINIDSDNDKPIQIPIVTVHSSINGMEDSDDESPVEIPVSKVPLTEISNSPIAVKDSPTTPLHDKNETKLGKEFSKDEKRERNYKNRRNEPQYDNPVRKSTLLEKLLADDIRHERNVIMQCIRHVVKKNFFGIGSNS